MRGSDKKRSKATFGDENPLLEWLHPDPQEAAETYRKLQEGLIEFFVARGCSEPEELVDETIDRVIHKLRDLKLHFQGEPATYFYGVANMVYLEYSRRKPTLPNYSDAHTDAEDQSGTEDQDIAKPTSNAAMYLRLLGNGFINLLALVLVVLLNRAFVTVARWILPDNGSAHQLFEYSELVGFILAVVSALFTLLFVLHGLLRFQMLRRQRILSRLQVTEEQFYQGLRYHVRSLLGGTSN